MRFSVGARPMQDTFRHHEQLPGIELNRHTLRQIDVDPPLDHEKKIIRVGMRMPWKFTLYFRHHDIVAVEFRNRARGEMLAELRKLAGKIDSRGLHGPLLMNEGTPV